MELVDLTELQLAVVPRCGVTRSLVQSWVREQSLNATVRAASFSDEIGMKERSGGGAQLHRKRDVARACGLRREGARTVDRFAPLRNHPCPAI